MSYIDLKTVPSGLAGGAHFAVFAHGPQVFVEFDRYMIDRLKAANMEDVAAVIALLQEYKREVEAMAKAYPFIAGLVSGAAKGLPGKILAKAGITSGQAASVAVAFILIEAAIIVVRALEINYAHMHSVNGGVIIQLVFPNPQIQSVVYPRGGFASEGSIGKASAATKSAASKVSSGVSAMKSALRR